jgi:transcriptional regulator with XRE-family HTH domain
MNLHSHVEALKMRLAECPATREEIAAATGLLSASWVSKFASGRMRNPRLDSLVALELALSHFERGEAA